MLREPTTRAHWRSMHMATECCVAVRCSDARTLCAAGRGSEIGNDIWLNRTLRRLANAAFDRFGETA